MFIAFPQQQCSGEHALVIRFTYIDCPVGQVEVITGDGICGEEKCSYFCFAENTHTTYTTLKFYHSAIQTDKLLL